MPRHEGLTEKLKNLPLVPGVYLMKNSVDKIIYVGKAKNLRNRVRSYFNDIKDMPTKTRTLVLNIFDLEIIQTNTEIEAFLLEASLIKKHRPKYNIRLKDDKSYPYIRVSVENQYPRIYLSRRVRRDGSMYFGPYTSGYAVNETIRFLNRTFKIRDCTDHMFKTRQRPCMTYQIGRCTAPCVKLITAEDYKLDIEGALMFLKGQDTQVIANLTARMYEFASQEKFEGAARLRDSIRAIQAVLEKQSIVSQSVDLDQDAVNFFGDERGTLIETVHVRAGRVIGTRAHFLPQLNTLDPNEDPREWLVSFLNQYYDDNMIPDEIIIPLEIGSDLTKLLEAVLKERSGKVVNIRMGMEEKSRDLVSLAFEKAQEHFAKHVTKSEEKIQGLEEIQRRLELPALPRRIECYDISNFQGQEPVASQVVFEDGVPSREHYRRYKIKTVQGPNDFASMHEVLTRRLKHTEYDDPHLIVVDGGKGQLKVATEVLKEMGRTDLSVVGLAKARLLGDFQDAHIEESDERFFLPGRQNPVVFQKGSVAYQILVGIRDEAHRFAITYHRKLRENTTLESELDLVTGLGEKRKRALLEKFDSVQALKAADVQTIAETKGFNKTLAERILLQLNEAEAETSEDPN